MFTTHDKLIRKHQGVALPELVVALGIAAILSATVAVAGGFWQGRKVLVTNAAQVTFIIQALKEYTRTHADLPDLSDATDIQQWLEIYRPPGSPTMPNGQPRTMPEGITYILEQQYIPSTLALGQVPGSVTLQGTGCDLKDPRTSCTFTVVP